MRRTNKEDVVQIYKGMILSNKKKGWNNTIWVTRMDLKVITLSEVRFSSVQFSHSVKSNFLWPHGLQHARPASPWPTPRVYSNYVHCVCEAIQPSNPLSSPFPSAFNLSQHQYLFKWVKLFTSGGQSIIVLASASVLPMNIQDWFPLGWTGWISLQSKWLSRVFSNTTVQKHQFFGTQLSV